MDSHVTNTVTNAQRAQSSSDGCQRKSGRGAPVANANAIRHGLRSLRWPAGTERAQRENNYFRRQLEELAFAVSGEVSVTVAMAINEAVEHEKVRQLCARWLRIGFSELSASERMAYLRLGADAATKRNAAIQKLKLDDVKASEIWDVLQQIDDRQDLLPAAPAATHSSVTHASGNELTDILPMRPNARLAPPVRPQCRSLTGPPLHWPGQAWQARHHSQPTATNRTHNPTYLDGAATDGNHSNETTAGR